jgi:alcohol dehydrogenase
MRALLFDKQPIYAPAHADPTPGADECVIQVHLAGICSTDLQITRGYMNFTGILGHEMVGTVVQGSPPWQGKRVACEINCVCRTCDMCQAGLSNHCRGRTVLGIAGRDGCFADYVAMPEHNLHAIPDTVVDEEAVFVEPLAAAWQVVKQVPVEPRMKVVVVGSGRLGLLVAQVMHSLGCRIEVVGRNPATLLMCEKKHIQATHVGDVSPNNDRDLVVECTGSPEGMKVALGLVRPRGTVVLKSTYAGEGALDLAPAVINEVNIVGSRCGPFRDAIDSLARGQIDVRSMISRSFPIDRGVEALAAAADPANVKVLLKINAR